MFRCPPEQDNEGGGETEEREHTENTRTQQTDTGEADGAGNSDNQDGMEANENENTEMLVQYIAQTQSVLHQRKHPATPSAVMPKAGAMMHRLRDARLQEMVSKGVSGILQYDLH